eukprot:s3973_g5.t1
MRLEGAPARLPQIPPPASVAQIFFDDFAANFKRMSSWSSRCRKDLLQAKVAKCGKALFAMLAPEPKPPLDCFVKEHKTRVEVVQGTTATLDSALPSWHPTSILLDGHFVTMKRLAPSTVQFSGNISPELGQSVILRKLLTSFDEIQQELLNLWTSKWHKHVGTPLGYWDRVVQFGLAYLPKLQIHYQHIDLSTWKAALRRHKSRSATGPDGWSINDLRHLPDTVHHDILALFAKVEQDGLWPVQLTTGFVCAIAKVVGASTASQFRPIVVVSVIYRVWASIRGRQLLGWLADHAPEGLHGYMQGKQCSDIWYALQGDIEATVALASTMSGYVADIVKCFNCLGHEPIFRLATHLGIPSPILTAWRSSVTNLQRRFRIRSDVGDAVSGATGFAEGDPLSCVAIAVFDFCWHAYMTQYAPSCRSVSYVDNLELLARTGSQVHHGCLVMATFLEAWDLELDQGKSFAWALDSRTRSELRAFGYSVSISSRDLGGQMNYGAISRVGVMLDRFESLDCLWNRLRTLPAGIPQKLHVLRAVAWPKALHGCESVSFAESHVDRLRSRAMEALKWKRPGASPLVRFSLLSPMMFDPGFYQVWAVLKLFHQHACPTGHAQLWWLTFVRHWNGVSGQGPMRKLRQVLDALQWDLDSTGCLVFGCFRSALIALPLAALRRLAEYAWNLYVCRRLQHRLDYKGLVAVDLSCDAGRNVAPSERHLLATIQDGTSFSNSFKSKFDDRVETNCRLCDQPDSLEHRCLACPRYEAARSKHHVCIRDWSSQDVAFNLHALPNAFPQLLEYWKRLTTVRDSSEDFQFLPESHAVYHLFTDGSCARPADPQRSLASWACMHPDSNRVLSAGPLPGILQSINRTELTAILSALHWQQRGPCEVHVWSDSAYAVEGIAFLKTGQNVPSGWDNEDLWKLVQRELRQASANFWVHHIPSHCSPDAATTPFQDWLIAGNEKADAAAAAAATHWPESVQVLNRRFCRHHQRNLDRQVRQAAFLVDVAKISQEPHEDGAAQDDEDVRLNQLAMGVEANELHIAGSFSQDADVLNTLTQFPAATVQKLAPWVCGVDLAASSQRVVAILELMVAFVLDTGAQIPIGNSNHGESSFALSSEVVAAEAECVTVAGALRVFERLLFGVLRCGGVVFQREAVSLAKHGIFKTMVGIKMGWPACLSLRVSTVLDSPAPSTASSARPGPTDGFRNFRRKSIPDAWAGPSCEPPKPTADAHETIEGKSQRAREFLRYGKQSRWERTKEVSNMSKFAKGYKMLWGVNFFAKRGSKRSMEVVA